MANLKRKIESEQTLRELLDTNNLPQPDTVQYGERSIRCLWREQQAAVIIDLDEPDEPDLEPWPGSDRLWVESDDDEEDYLDL